MKKVKIGIIGCGNISGIYLQTAPTFDILELDACADLIMDRARRKRPNTISPAFSPWTSCWPTRRSRSWST